MQQSELGENTMFDRRYLLQPGGYEEISLPGGPGVYRESARIQGGLGQLMTWRVNRQLTVVDLGCGTGNSTLELAKAYNALAVMPIILFGIDPSRDSLTVLQRKRGKINDERWSAFTRGVSISAEVDARLERERETSDPISLLIQGQAEHMPAKADIVHTVQVFHWTDPKETLKSIRSILQPGGLFIFDESGLQMDYEEIAVDGKKINTLHPFQHPFHRTFLEKFAQVYHYFGFNFDPDRIDPYHHMFNLSKLRSLLESAEFELVPIDFAEFEKIAKRIGSPAVPFQGDDDLYQGVLIPRDNFDIEQFILGGANMRYF